LVTDRYIPFCVIQRFYDQTPEFHDQMAATHRERPF
jgi:hypothetical protein